MRPIKYSPETLQKALDEVRSGSLSAYAAHKKYDIPKSTLSDKLKGIHSQRLGNDTVLSASYEQQLADWILLCAASGCPKTTKEILEAASELASLQGNTFKGGLPSTGWLNKFLHRHPEISKRTPEALGRASAGLTADRLERYFVYLYSQFEQGQMLHLLDRPASWWNVDETNFLMNPVPKKVYARKGVKVVYNVERGKPKENITCTYAVAADGSYIPPLVTFKDSFGDLVAAATASGSVGANFGFNQTQSGWMKGDAFYFFVTQHLNPRWIEMGTQRPIVLVVDGYSGHHSLKLYRWCYENDVKLVVLYPNSTHILQVLDVAVFGPLKAKYTDLYQKWKYNNAGKMFNEIEFVKLLKQTNDAVIQKDTIVNGWRSTGLQPFDFKNMDKSRLTKTSRGTPESSVEIQEFANSLDKNQDFPQPAEHLQRTDPNNNLHDISNWSNMNLLNPDSQEPVCATDRSLSESIEPANDINRRSPSEEESSTCFSSQLVTEQSDQQQNLPNNSFEFDFDWENATPNNPTSSVCQQTKKLVSKARESIDKLRIHLKVNDPSKLVNILIMKQQLNIIEPVVIETSISLPRTSSDILNLPKVVSKSARPRKGLKVSYGVMSDVEIIKEMEQREVEEQKAVEDREADEIARAEREKKMRKVKEELSLETERIKATREKLKLLETEAATERKKISMKRKLQNVTKKTKQLVAPDTQISRVPKKRIRVA